MDLRIVNRAGEQENGATPRLRSGRGPSEGLARAPRSRSSGDRMEVIGSRCGSAADSIRSKLFQWRRKLATGAVIFIAAYLSLHVVLGSNGWIAYQKKRAEYRQLQTEIENLQKQNQALEQHVKALRSDPEAIKREAREQLHLAKPGEMIFIVPSQKPPEPKSPANATAEKK